MKTLHLGEGGSCAEALSLLSHSTDVMIPLCPGRDEELVWFFFWKVIAWDYFIFQILSMFVSKPYESNCITWTLGWCESHFVPSSAAAPVVASSEGLLCGAEEPPAVLYSTPNDL